MEKKLFLVAADIHGSLIGLQRTLDLVEEYHADKLILLGDIFGANATEMVEMLNKISNKLDIVKGNNDWYYEPENAKFEIYPELYENINGRLAYLCHGHKLNDMNLAGYGAKIVMMGHVHRPFIRQEQGVIWLCPGSVAVPRGSDKTFALIDDEKIQILSIFGELVDEFRF
jgi:hypothetical protein